MSATYNKGGLMLSETYPSGKVIETQYDGAGRIAGVKKQSLSTFITGGASSDAANRLQYTAHGGVSAMKLGNGLWEHVNFNSRLQPVQIGLGTSSTSTSVLGLDYGYGTTANNGNVVNQTITAPGLNVTQVYSYDQVNRLASATETNSGGQTWQQIYGYDVYGNRWVASGYKPNPTLTPQSQSAFNAANNRLTSALGFNYDLVGNLTSDPTTAAGAMVYDAENRQVSYTKASVTTTYGYDGDGRRVKKVDSTGTTVFVYNAGGQLVAEYTDAAVSGTVTMSYLTADHLGSTRVVTDGNQAVKARRDYLPYGEEIETSIGGRSGVAGYAAVDSTRQRFTSKERDTESGLDYFLARYYSGAQGRFTSVDPLLASAEGALPQSWNRYVYVLNNPLRLVDPDGQAPKDPKVTVKKETRTTTYKVQGQTARDAIENARNPSINKHEQGLPGETAITYNSALRSRTTAPKQTKDGFSSEASLTEVTVTVKTTVDLPNWEGLSTATPEDQAIWNDYIQALDSHEKEHVEIANQGADDIAKAIAGTPPAVGTAKTQKAAQDAATNNLKSAVQKNYDAANQATIEKQKQLDVETDHGKKKRGNE
jgi:RHS repeat-associated protein